MPRATVLSAVVAAIVVAELAGAVLAQDAVRATDLPPLLRARTRADTPFEPREVGATPVWTLKSPSIAQSLVMNAATDELLVGYSFVEDPGVAAVDPATGSVTWRTAAGGYWGYALSSASGASGVVAGIGCQFLAANCSVLVWDNAKSSTTAWQGVQPTAYTDFEPFKYDAVHVPPSGDYVAAMWYTQLSHTNNARPCRACVFSTTGGPTPLACVSSNVSYPRVAVSNDGARMLSMDAPGSTFITTVRAVASGKALFTSDNYVAYSAGLARLAELASTGTALRALSWDATTSTYKAQWTATMPASCTVTGISFSASFVAVVCVDGELAATAAVDAQVVPTSRATPPGSNATVKVLLFDPSGTSGSPTHEFVVPTSYMAVTQATVNVADSGTAVAASLEGAIAGSRKVFSSVYAAAIPATSASGSSTAGLPMSLLWSDATGCVQSAPPQFLPGSGASDDVALSYSTPNPAQPGWCAGSTVAAFHL